jgi:SNF2 family DNA or RNA helicase
MLYSAQHNACVYTTPAPERITACIPGALQIDSQRVVVPCKLPQMQAMRYMGYEAMSPIMVNYDWPRDTSIVPFPFDHQYHIASFLTLHRRCFNLSDMGTGKTLSTLWAYDFLMQLGLIQRVLILAPLSTLASVWEDAIMRHFIGRRTCNVVYGDRKKRSRLLAEERDFYIINHDGLGIGTSRRQDRIIFGELAEAIVQRKDITAVGVDEGSNYKDASTLRYKVLRKAVNEKAYLWWITGSPAANDPTDAHAQARMVRKNYFESKKDFKERTMYQVSTFKWVPRKDAAAKVAEILQPSIRYDIDDCIDLPPIVIETRDVELTPAQKKAHEGLRKTLQVQIGEGQITAINEASLRQKLIQIACGAVYGPEHTTHLIDCKPRLDTLFEVIQQAKGKVFVFAPLTSVINLLYLEIGKHYTVGKIDGTVSKAKRDEVLRGFQQAKDPHIIVAHPETMAHGIDGTAADLIVWYGPMDDGEIYEQANRRIKRPGQKRSMLIVRLASTPTEREIYRRLEAKESMQGLILNIIRGDD